MPRISIRRTPVSATGVSAIGSSEAVMLAGLALNRRWRAVRPRDSLGAEGIFYGTEELPRLRE